MALHVKRPACPKCGSTLLTLTSGAEELRSSTMGRGKAACMTCGYTFGVAADPTAAHPFLPVGHAVAPLDPAEPPESPLLHSRRERVSVGPPAALDPAASRKSRVPIQGALLLLLLAALACWLWPQYFAFWQERPEPETEAPAWDADSALAETAEPVESPKPRRAKAASTQRTLIAKQLAEEERRRADKAAKEAELRERVAVERVQRRFAPFPADVNQPEAQRTPPSALLRKRIEAISEARKQNATALQLDDDKYSACAAAAAVYERNLREAQERGADSGTLEAAAAGLLKARATLEEVLADRAAALQQQALLVQELKELNAKLEAAGETAEPR
jgi:hypothetical protein